MDTLQLVGKGLELSAAGFIIFRAWQAARVWKVSREHFKSWAGVGEFVDAVSQSASGQFRDQGIAFAVLVLGVVIQSL